MSDFLQWWISGPLDWDAGKLLFTSPQWLILLSSALAAGAFVIATLQARDRRLQAAELTCWAMALVGLTVAIAGPTWVEESGRTEAGRAVVLVDGSASMGIMENGVSRAQDVDKLIAHATDQLGPNTEVFTFGGEITAGPPDEFVLPGTDFEGALDGLDQRLAGEDLGALVLISDGLDRGALRRRYQQESVDGQAPLLPTLPGPVTIFQIGQRTDLLDLSVRDIRTGGYAFIRAPFFIEANVQGLGYENQTISVTLERDGAVVTRKKVTLDEEGKSPVRFEVVAEDAGRFAYAIRVPDLAEDAVAGNNVQSVVVRVVRDRIRVLQVAGTPGWDVKFLRRFLKGDPSVQLVSFFILRTHADFSTPYGQDELSLIAFPYERLFNEDLWSFDVVIFQNFDYEPYFNRNPQGFLTNIKKYVEDGGSFVMVGGDRSFGLGNYGRTPLADILPVRINDGQQPDLAPFTPLLTQAGKRHPITRLTSDPIENANWWKRLVPLDGTNLVSQATNDATVLLSHPDRTGADGNPLPILAVREAGKGRAMALTVDASWRWSLSEAAEGRGNQAYLRFWKNTIRWLMKDDSTARVTAETSSENVAIGEDLRLIVRAKDQGFAPLPDATVTATVNTPQGPVALEGTTNRDGEWATDFRSTVPGTHRVVAKVTNGKAQVGRAETVFAATTRDPEVDEIAPDPGFLAWLASGPGGKLYPHGELGTIGVDDSVARKVNDSREVPLFASPVTALWVTFFAGAAFWFRRRSGLR